VCSFRDESAKLPTNEANVPSRSHSKSTNSNVPFHETTTAELSITVPTTDEMEGVYSVVADVVVLYSPYPRRNGFTLK
jgi:hypothetical protein